MPHLQNRKERVLLATIEASPWISLEDLARGCPHMTWNELFSAIDAMSRRGTISLARRGFQYFVAPRGFTMALGAHAKS